MSVTLLLLASLWTVVVSHSHSVFLPTALDGLQVQLRGRDAGPDITEVEVFVRPEEVLVSPQEVQAGSLSLGLQVQEEGGCWRAVAGQPIKRGRKLRWRVAIAPCLEYSFRVMASSTTCMEYLEYPKVLGNSPLYLVEKAKRFTPGVPEHLRLEGNSSLTWDPVPCVSHYQVRYAKEGEQLDDSNTTLVDSNIPISIPELLGCETVTVQVGAVSGERMSQGTKYTFNTCAKEDTTADVASLLFEDNTTCPELSPLPLCQMAVTEEQDVQEAISNSPLSQEVPSMSPLSEETPSLVYILSGVAVALVLTGVLVVICVMLLRKRKHHGSMDVSP